MAHADPRVVSGAVIGGLAGNGGDRWSDLDLTFGVADDVPVGDVLADWTRRLADELEAVHLFDLGFESTTYRVFLLPGCLQVDLSFTPAAEFGALGPKFTLLFGEAVERDQPPPPSAHHLFGLGVHHAVRARFCIERGRLWQAEYWISGVRDQALALACLRSGLNPSHGRGIDDLPAEALEAFRDGLVRAVERDELLRALGVAVDALLRESAEAREVAANVESELRGLVAPSR
jgi:hypothetical protein